MPKKKIEIDYMPFTDVPEVAYTPDYDKFHLSREIESLLHYLKPREAEIIKMRFGLMGYFGHGHKRIADKMGISSSRVSEIVLKSLKKLRSHALQRRLQER